METGILRHTFYDTLGNGIIIAIIEEQHGIMIHYFHIAHNTPLTLVHQIKYYISTVFKFLWEDCNVPWGHSLKFNVEWGREGRGAETFKPLDLIQTKRNLKLSPTPDKRNPFSGNNGKKAHIYITSYARRTYLGDEGSIVLHQSLIRIVRDNIMQKN